MLQLLALQTSINVCKRHLSYQQPRAENTDLEKQRLYFKHHLCLQVILYKTPFFLCASVSLPVKWADRSDLF